MWVDLGYINKTNFWNRYLQCLESLANLFCLQYSCPLKDEVFFTYHQYTGPFLPNIMVKFCFLSDKSNAFVWFSDSGSRSALMFNWSNTPYIRINTYTF